MSFRRKSNSHDLWLSVVRESASLLSGLPPEAIASEARFRDYVTRGMIDGRSVAPSVFDLSPQSLDDLFTFMHHKRQFDMDVTLFDNFNEAFRLRHRSNTDNAPNTSLERTCER
jgi:hypothetical protein